MMMRTSKRTLAFVLACIVLVTTCFTVSISALNADREDETYDNGYMDVPNPDPEVYGLLICEGGIIEGGYRLNNKRYYGYFKEGDVVTITENVAEYSPEYTAYFKNWQLLQPTEDALLINDCTIVDCKAKTTQLILGKVCYNDQSNYSWKVYATKSPWSYCDPGTGMPDPDDETEGLPYPNENITYVRRYDFRYEPTVLDYYTYEPITTAQAGDLVWLKISVEDINLELAPYGFSCFEGTVTFDVEKMHMLYYPLTIGDYISNFENANYWTEAFIHISIEEGMSRRCAPESWFAPYWIPDHCRPYWSDGETAGYGYHWGTNVKGHLDGMGVYVDGSWYMCLPILLNDDLVEGEEYTFTVPYPRYEQGGVVYSTRDNMIDPDDVYTLYGRGGAYTITIKNHADIDNNIASSAAYIAGSLNSDLTGEKSSGYLNDNRYPLSEVSDYVVFEGGAQVDMTFAAPATVDGAKITFNQTSTTELPTSVTAYGVKADGTKVLLGSATDGVAYRAGTDETWFYEQLLSPEDEESIHVNYSNAYSYSISGFDSAKYVGIYVEATAADGAKIAIGEIEVYGELSKLNVTIENGTIADPAEDDLYDVDTVLTIKADTIADKVFTGWEIKDGGAGTFADATSSETTFTVGGADTVIVAKYTDALYDLTVVDGTGSGQYAKNSTVTITANTAPDGQYFDHWEVKEGNAVVADVNSATTTVTTASGASKIVAVYADNIKLTVIGGSGSCECAPGDTCTIKAETRENYTFYKWVVTSGDAVISNPSAATTTVVVNGNATVTAMFVSMYKNVPDNLALYATVTLESGNVAFGTLASINDGIYPITGTKYAVTSGTLIPVFALDDLYDVDKLALTFAINPGTKSELPSSFKIYSSTSASADDRQLIAEISGLDSSAWTMIGSDEYPDFQGYFYRSEVDIAYPIPGRYIIIDFTGNSNLIVGEIEIYGEQSRFIVDVAGGSILNPSEDGKYLPGTVLTLVPDEAPTDKAFAGWSHCGLGTLDSANNTFTVGEGDAQISAVFVDMHKAVPDNIAPNSTFKLLKGTTASDLGTTDASGWLTGGYINDQLYPLTMGAKWALISSTGNSISIIAKLDAAYDISQVAVTVGFDPVTWVMKPAIGIKVYGLNSETETGVLLGENSRADLRGYEQITFDQTVNLPVLAARYLFDASAVDSYRYIRIDFTCMTGINDINFGEIEIYGSKSMFNVELVNGTADPSMLDNMYYPETVITIKANDLPDKEFIGWTLETSDGTIADASSAETTFTVGYGNNKITANYKTIKYKLTVNNGTGTGEYERYSAVLVNANTSTDPEKVFDKWVVVSGKVVGITDPYSATTIVTTDGVAVVEATYKDRVYALTVENGTGSGDYANNSTATITANTAPADMIFDHWEIVTGSGTLADANAASTTFTTSNAPTTLRAVYRDILYTVTVNGGSISNPSESGYTVNTRLVLEPITPDHQTFVKWELVSGNGTFVDATDPNTTFVLGSGNAVINAIYKDIEYSLKVENGTGGGNYVYNKVVDISATVPDGYLFAGWTLTSGEATIADASSAQTTVTVLGDAVVTANFVEKEYSVDVINGTLSSDDETFKKGTTLTITADEPAANMKFAGWTIVSGNATIADASSPETTITVGNSDVVVRANYEDILYVLTVENGTGSGSYKYNSVVEISADKASSNMHFLKWEVVSGNATIADASSADTTVTMGDEAAVVRAVYTDDLYSVTVENGTATGIDPDGNKVGTVITVTADEPEDGYKFDKWIIVSGDGEFGDETKENTTFTLGVGDTVIKAQYAKITTPPTGDMGIALYALIALLALAGTAVVIKKKQK